MQNINLTLKPKPKLTLRGNEPTMQNINLTLKPKPKLTLRGNEPTKLNINLTIKLKHQACERPPGLDQPYPHLMSLSGGGTPPPHSPRSPEVGCESFIPRRTWAGFACD